MNVERTAKSWKGVVFSSWVTRVSLIGLVFLGLLVAFTPYRQLLLPWFALGIGVFFVYVGTGLVAEVVVELRLRRFSGAILPTLFALVLFGAGAQAIFFAFAHAWS